MQLMRHVLCCTTSQVCMPRLLCCRLHCRYCAGRDLAACLGLKVSGSSRRLFGWYSRGRKVAMNIAAAVNFLHSRGIVHFDM